VLEDTFLRGRELTGIIAEKTTKRHYIMAQHPFFLETLLGIAAVMAAWYKFSGDGTVQQCLDAYLERMSGELENCRLSIFEPCLLEGSSGVAITMSRIHALTGSETALSIGRDAVNALVNGKQKLPVTYKEWSYPLLYGETGIVFALYSLPDTLRDDNHRRVINTALDRYMSHNYNFMPENSGVSPYFSAVLQHALNRCFGADIPVQDIEISLLSNDTLCYGNAGIIAGLLDKRAAECCVQERGWLLMKAREIGGYVAAKAEQNGGFGLNAAARLPFPGFFHGEAGILYHLIRLLVPDEVPAFFCH
jgi:lantibiotic modifying enzyme